MSNDLGRWRHYTAIFCTLRFLPIDRLITAIPMCDVPTRTRLGGGHKGIPGGHMFSKYGLFFATRVQTT